MPVAINPLKELPRSFGL